MTLKNLFDLIRGLFGGSRKLKSTTAGQVDPPMPVIQENAGGSQNQVNKSVDIQPAPENNMPEIAVEPTPAPLPETLIRKYQILREPDQRVQTLGTFTITEGNTVVFSCKTIELPWRNNERTVSCIPAGIYRTVRYTSPKYGQCFWLQDVPGRSEILIHHGNYAGSRNPHTGTPDTRGCILPGDSYEDIDKDDIVDIKNSLNTMKRLREILPDEFQLEIRTKS